ncbi:MAG: ABC transporter substrate-binding protein [Cyanobacteria bacterium J083]|nr:MAG: ABC transporter substrate-binding protein [Cyanobacteria bacterium J083]
MIIQRKSLKKLQFCRKKLFYSLLIGTIVIFSCLHWLGIPLFAQNKVTISILMRAPEAKQWQELETKFEAENPEIDLVIFPGPNATNLVEDIYTSAYLLGDSPYDLVLMDIVWVPKFAAAGWLMPLSNKLDEAELQKFMPGDLNGGMYEGELYRIPVRTDAGMLYYRTDLLEKIDAVPPETLQDLVRISKELQAKNLVEFGYLWQGKQYEGLSAMFVEILQGYGAFWIDATTKEVGLDSEAAIAAVKFLKSTIGEISPAGVTTYAEEETRLLFQNGKAAFLRNWPYVYKLLEDSVVANKYDIKPMPYQPPGGKSGACQGGWGLGISVATPHPEAAWRVIEFFSSARVQKILSSNYGYTPTRKALFQDPDLVKLYPHLPNLQKVLENSVLRPAIPQYAQASDILQRYLSAALTNKMSVEKAMNRAAKETRQLLGEL